MCLNTALGTVCAGLLNCIGYRVCRTIEVHWVLCGLTVSRDGNVLRV